MVKVRGLTPNVVRERVVGRRVLQWEEQIDFFRKDKYVFRRMSRR